ncbi:DUF5119 domain-containing protein [Xylanibacter muris]|uniref:DUF5119 domain-containing protein n=1 Tax=Xylanibacter muris TaxID=2736290 RepID=A0ABX2ALI1_9BACT|nr:DUF5119 domain-containing protein [Xylanibacter muris]NPD91079.1 DUF5119 domain-containing protein [Xylanibacter muris]
MKPHHIRFAVTVILVLATSLCSCEHKDLCFNHPKHSARYESKVAASYELIWEMRESDGFDWSACWPESFGYSYHSLNPSMPEGLCVNTYGGNGQKTSRHLPPTGGVIEMTPGINSLLMYNDDTEYIIFNDLNISVSAKATTRVRSRAGYTGNTLNTSSGNKTEKTVSPPDPLFGYYIEKYDQQPMVNPMTIRATMKPLVFKYVVRYEFTRGIEYAGLARGAMTGMAGSVFMYDGHTGNDRVTILYDCNVYDWGIEAVVNSFGIPNYPNNNYSRSGDFYGLNLEVMLKNGKVINFDHDVTKLIAAQPHGGVILITGLEISDKDGNESGSGFDIDVDGWGEYEDIIIDI